MVISREFLFCRTFLLFQGREGISILLTYVQVSSTLECVEFKEMIMGEENGVKLENYFHENSAVLKKLYLRACATRGT